MSLPSSSVSVRGCCAALFLSVLTGSTFGADVEWDAGDGLWNVASHWDPNAVPTSLDHVFIGVNGGALT